MSIDTVSTRAFRVALFLDGWGRRSVWGWDEMTSTLFATLWLDTDDRRDPPRVWLSGTRNPTADPGELARRISAATGATMAAVLEALADQAPASVRDLLPVPA